MQQATPSAYQLARSGGGVSSNYRSARRARSRNEFISRLAVALDEADESEHWLSVAGASGLSKGLDSNTLLKEARELRAILSASLQTARRNHNPPPSES